GYCKLSPTYMPFVSPTDPVMVTELQAQLNDAGAVTSTAGGDVSRHDPQLPTKTDREAVAVVVLARAANPLIPAVPVSVIQLGPSVLALGRLKRSQECEPAKPKLSMRITPLYPPIPAPSPLRN